MTEPQTMQLRRRRGAQRGEHGSYIAPATPASDLARSEPSGPIGTDTDSTTTDRPAVRPTTAREAARAAYDAKPKVIFRGVDEDTYFKLRAIYKHQLHSPDGIEGWSEFGRRLLRDFVERYEAEFGEMTGGQDVELSAGRRMGT